MKKIFFHKLLSIFLVFIFQFPGWLQLEHSLHKHDSIHQCNASGATKHIHLKVNQRCEILHHQILSSFTFDKTIFTLGSNVFYGNFFHQKTSNLSLQFFSDYRLRAPPFF